MLRNSALTFHFCQENSKPTNMTFFFSHWNSMPSPTYILWKVNCLVFFLSYKFYLYSMLYLQKSLYLLKKKMYENTAGRGWASVLLTSFEVLDEFVNLKKVNRQFFTTLIFMCWRSSYIFCKTSARRKGEKKTKKTQKPNRNYE